MNEGLVFFSFLFVMSSYHGISKFFAEEGEEKKKNKKKKMNGQKIKKIKGGVSNNLTYSGLGHARSSEYIKSRANAFFLLEGGISSNQERKRDKKKNTRQCEKNK